MPFDACLIKGTTTASDDDDDDDDRVVQMERISHHCAHGVPAGGADQ